LVNSPENPWSQSGRRQGRLRWEGFGKEVLSLESEWVMNGESGESIELIEKVPLKELGVTIVEISACLTEGSQDLILETRKA